MLEGDHAIIMDFGIARSTSRVGSTPQRPAAETTGAPKITVDADTEVTRIAETLVGEVIGTIDVEPAAQPVHPEAPARQASECRLAGARVAPGQVPKEARRAGAPG